MRARAALSVAAGILLVASVALKVPISLQDVATTSSLSPKAIADVFDQRGYVITGSSGGGTPTWISARRDACDVTVIEVSPDGWHRSIMETGAGDRELHYAFSGQIYSEQPVMLTRLSHHWNRAKRYLGLRPIHRPVLAILALHSCTNLPFRELATMKG